MKTAGSTLRRTPITAWQRKPNAKNAVLQRIQTVTKELGAIQAEIYSQFAKPAEGKISAFFEDDTAAQVFNNFKAEIDQLRRILWFHIEEVAGQSHAAADQETQAHRVQRVTELLRALSPRPAAPAVAGEESGSFFERLDLVIDNYMKEKKPVAAETKAPPRARR